MAYTLPSLPTGQRAASRRPLDHSNTPVIASCLSGLVDVAELFECRFGDIVSVAFEGQAHGPLRPGFGVPDGTPGLIHTAQMNGLFLVATRVNHHSIVAQWWGQPGKIFLQPVGK